DGMGEQICDVLRFWREQIESGSLKERRQARKHLKAFGKALIPETRGKRQNKLLACPWEVKEFYLKELYRIWHVEHFLKSVGRNNSQKVKQASERYGMSIEQIRAFRGLDEDDNPQIGLSWAPKDMAREWTARRFNINPRTVLNLLSS